MSWHPFRAGREYALSDVLATCRRRLGEKDAVVAVKVKERLLELMAEHAPEVIVWTPTGPGWGRSPFNPDRWRTAKGGPILPEELVSAVLAKKGIE